MKTYLQPKLELIMFEKDVLTDIITSSDELIPLGGDFSDFWG